MRIQVTIDAPPSDVWLWLVQGGYRGAGRAGWYTDSWFDMVVEAGHLRLTTPAGELTEHPGARSHTAILPEFQHLTVGDIVPDGPPDSAYFVVKGIDPERSLVLYSDTATGGWSSERDSVVISDAGTVVR